MPKIQPSVLTLSFAYQVANALGTGDRKYIDISQCVSILNRRFYRQGLNWAVAGIKIMTNGTQKNPAISTTFAVAKLPVTWVMSNAWEKSFRAWLQMIKNATDESGAQSIKGKFLDFKIYADASHHAAGYGDNLLPYDSTVTYAVPGMWQPSELEIPNYGPGAAADPGNTTTFELIAVGPNNPGAGASGHDAKSLVTGYAKSRALPSPKDPNVPFEASDAVQNWMMALFNDGTEQDSLVIDNLEDAGINPPYPFEGDVAGTADTMYPGGETQLPGLEIHDKEYFTSTTIGGNTYLKGGMFPCGLMAFEIVGFTEEDYIDIQIDLVPGNHRGYACTPMQEM